MEQDEKCAVAAPVADTAVGAAASARSSPPVLPTDDIIQTEHPRPAVGADSTADTCSAGAPFHITSGASSSASDNDFEVTELPGVAGQATIVDGVDGEEESVEALLGSLMRTLNTEKGRADFRLLAATGSTP